VSVVTGSDPLMSDATEAEGAVATPCFENSFRTLHRWTSCTWCSRPHPVSLLGTTCPERLDSLLDLPGWSVGPPGFVQNPGRLLSVLIHGSWNVGHPCGAGGARGWSGARYYLRSGYGPNQCFCGLTSVTGRSILSDHVFTVRSSPFVVSQ